MVSDTTNCQMPITINAPVQITICSAVNYCRCFCGIIVYLAFLCYNFWRFLHRSRIFRYCLCTHGNYSHYHAFNHHDRRDEKGVHSLCFHFPPHKRCPPCIYFFAKLSKIEVSNALYHKTSILDTIFFHFGYYYE